MTIKTKFNKNDQVFFLYKDKVRTGKVYAIRIYYGGCTSMPIIGIQYELAGDDGTFPDNIAEKHLAKSKNALAKKLFNQP